MDTTEYENLFSYGTLQRETVQLATFGRKLDGEADILPGYRQTQIEIKDPAVIASSGDKYYLNVEFTGRDEDTIIGTRFKVTADELTQSDLYEETAQYKRITVQLKSGNQAWVYRSVAADNS